MNRPTNTNIPVTLSNNNLNAKRPLVESTYMPISFSPCSPSTSSSSSSTNSNTNKQPIQASNLNTSSSSTSSTSNQIESITIFNDLNLKLSIITQALKNNELVLNCVQFVNLIDLYFEDDLTTNNTECTKTKTNNESNNFLYDSKHCDTSASSNSDLKLSTETTSMTTTCFPCIVCSNRFSFEQTFHLHLERRSILIRFYCIKCQAYKSFYNKCKLLYHVYSHKMYLFEPIYKSIKIESITMDRLNLSKERNIDFTCCINISFTNELDELFSDTASAPFLADLNESLIMTRSNRVQLNDNENIKMFLKRLIQNNFLLFRCSICDALFFDLKELKIHYYKSQQHELEHLNSITNNGSTNNPITTQVINNTNQTNRRYIYKNLKQKYISSFSKQTFNFLTENNLISNNDYLIKTFVNALNDISAKKLQFSTRCSTLANMNLISNNYQFYMPANNLSGANNRQLICPECGITFDSKTQQENFRLHLVYECLFTSKYDCGQIKCSAHKCNYIAQSVNDFVAHWSKIHIKNEHQCDLCDKKGIKYVFENQASNIQTDSNNKNTPIMKTIMNHQDQDCVDSQTNTPETNIYNEPILSSSTISEINKHFFEKHRNLQVSLKLVYRCSCKTSTNLNENQMNNATSSFECEHITWKGCHKHIISLIARTLASISCLICNTSVPNNEYQAHLKTMHNLEKICICPICGILNDETSLQNHILKMHSQLSLHDHPTSSFFNLLATLNKQANTSPQFLNLNNGNFQNLIQTLNQIVPSNFFIYQCLNCRLYFASNCKFSHNCWTYTESAKSASNDQKQNQTNNNYFSPIYLKFNINKAISSNSSNLFEQRQEDSTENSNNNNNTTNNNDNNNNNQFGLNKKIKIKDMNTEINDNTCNTKIKDMNTEINDNTSITNG